MHRTLLAVASLAAALLASLPASEASAQPPGGRGRGMGLGGMMSDASLLRQEAVQADLGLAADLTTKIAGLLDAKQLARLKQIRVQALGAGALMDETLAKELSITDDQVAKFQSAMQAMRQGGGGGGGNPGEMRAKMTAKAMEILSADQKAKLEALKGPAFDVSKLQIRGPGGGGRPGAGT